MIITRESIRIKARADARRDARHISGECEGIDIPMAYPENPDAQAEYEASYAEAMADMGVTAEA